jgi:hypothetical protein
VRVAAALWGVLAAALLASPAAALAFPHGGSAVSTTVSANLASPGASIPANFGGFAVDPTDVITNSCCTGSSNLVGLASLLGTIGVLRVGGTDQDSNPAPALIEIQP